MTGMTKSGGGLYDTASSVGSVFTALESQQVDWDAMSSVSHSNRYALEDTAGVNIDAQRLSASESPMVSTAATPAPDHGWLASLKKRRELQMGADGNVAPPEEEVPLETMLAGQQLDDYLDNLSIAGSAQSEVCFSLHVYACIQETMIACCHNLHTCARVRACAHWHTRTREQIHKNTRTHTFTMYNSNTRTYCRSRARRRSQQPLAALRLPPANSRQQIQRRPPLSPLLRPLLLLLWCGT